jgi:hypothetical protein
MPNNVAYRDYVDELLSLPDRPFSPFAEYDADGDCIEFFVKPDPYYAERIDALLTVYRSQKTQEVVGSLIEGVSHVCREILWRSIRISASRFTRARFGSSISSGRSCGRCLARRRFWSRSTRS